MARDYFKDDSTDYWDVLDTERRERWAEIVKLRNSGLTWFQVALRLDISERQIYRLLKEHREEKELEGGE